MLASNAFNESEAGTLKCKGELSKAGRALQKKAGRLDSAFPKPTGTPEEVSLQGQKVLDEILSHPDKIIKIRDDATARMGYEVIDVIVPKGTGARFTKDGKKLICFLEPQK